MKFWKILFSDFGVFGKYVILTIDVGVSIFMLHNRNK